MKAAVVGTGFIGVVHVEALRRLGIEIAGVVGSSPERAAEKPGLPEPVRELRGDARRRARRRRPPDDAEPPPPSAGEGRAGRRQARRLREAARAHLDRVGRAARARGGERARPLHELQHPLLSALPRGARPHPARRPRPGLERARPLRPGLAARIDRLELAARSRGRGLAAGGRRHRHPLARPDGLDHRSPGQGRARRPLHRARGPARPDGSGRDLRRCGRRRARRPGHVHRGRGAHPAPLRGRKPRPGDDLPGQRRPEEPPLVRGRRLEGRARVGLGPQRGALARPSRPAERARGPRSRPARRQRARGQRPAGRARGRLHRHLQAALPRRLPRRRGGCGCRPSRTSRPSRTGTRRSCSATRSPRRRRPATGRR